MNLKVVETGDNAATHADVNVDGISGEDLRRVVERIERLEEEKQGIAADVRAIYAEAKAGGFDPKIIRKVIRLRAMEPHLVEEEEALVEIYKHALGMQ
ncbi:MAG: DUF2312 domain-containing protein [Magnetococcales bacterium]|nr:DUF2312 domain-containing protein [Magnetococcales bacterium]